MYVDSHSHIEMADFDPDRDEMIQRALEAGVDTIVAVGNGDVGNDSHSGAFRLAERYDFIYTTAGVHPHEARLLDAGLYEKIAGLARHPRVIAIGEIGLDYHYDYSPRDQQRAAFRKQIGLARERRLPIVVHTREAEADTLAILTDEWTGSERPGIVHCFTGTGDFAQRVVEMGFYISFSGALTFKKSEDLRQTAAKLPVDRILVETDCPFMAPEPFRGRRNEPAFVVQTARRLAEVRGLDGEDVARATSDNFRRAFELDGATGGST